MDVRSGAREGENRPAVVICHGFKGFKDWGMFPKLADRLAVAGFIAISFNFSGSGVSEGDQFDELDRWGHQRPSTDLEDVATVVDFALANGASSVGLVGHSRGGGLAILHAAKDDRVRALVTWASVDHFLRWPEDDIAKWRRDGRIDVVNSRTGQVLPLFRDALDDADRNEAGTLNVTAAAGRVRIPWLIVHGTADKSVSVEIGKLLKEASRSAKTELLLVESADHTFGIKHPWSGSTREFDIVLDRTVRLLAASL